MVLKQMNRLPEALGMFEEALSAYPNQTHLEKQRLMVLCAMGEYDRAVRLYDERLARNPGDVAALNFKAYAYYKVRVCLCVCVCVCVLRVRTFGAKFKCWLR